MKLQFKYFMAACIGAVFLLTGSLAQAASVDLTPLVQSGAELFIGATSLVVTGLLGMLFHNQRDVALRNALTTALENAAQYAIAYVAQQKVPKVEVPGLLVAASLNYVVRSVPKTIKHFGITDDRLSEMILARLNKAGAIPSDK
jgi:hypothetical protein